MRSRDQVAAHLVQAQKQRHHSGGHPLWWIWNKEVQRLRAELAAITEAEKEAGK